VVDAPGSGVVGPKSNSPFEALIGDEFWGDDDEE